MATTARGYRYPASTDNTQIWTHVQNLATDVDTDVTAVMAEVNRLGTIARGRRTTNSTGATTAIVGVLRLDNIPIITGRLYRIWTSPLIFESSASGDLVTMIIHTSTAGAATTASTQLTGLVETAYSASGSQRTKGLDVDYPSATTGSLSVLLSVVRSAGTGTVKINASSSYPCSLLVDDQGADPGDTGVII